MTSLSVGAVESIVKELTDKLSLVLLLLSVTVMVQLLYVPSAMALKVIVLLSASDELSELLQSPL